MAKTIHGKTLQVWPGGTSYEYRGDPDGPAGQRRLRAGHYQARVRCTAHCRERGVQHLTPEQYERYIAEKTAKGIISPVTSPDLVTVGRYVSAEGDDWTNNHVCTTCAGAGYIQNPKQNPWRPGTAAEWRAIRIELRAELYWDQNGRGCDSVLVDDLLKAANSGELSGDLRDAFSYDEIRNLYADPSDWDAARCREYASEEGVELPDDPCDTCQHCGQDITQAIAGGEWIGLDKTITCPSPDNAGYHNPSGEAEPYEDDSPRGWLTEAREACREHAQDHPAEVYEWWRVSDWLCGKLHEVGEVTISNNYGDWWGRTCTGQSLLMDGTLQEIAAKYERGED